MQPNLTHHRQLLDACTGQIQALTKLAQACVQEKQLAPVDDAPAPSTVTPPLTEDQIDAIEVLYEHGHSLRDIAKKAKRSRMTILRRLQERGVEMRPRMTKKLNPDQVNELVARYQHGEPANLVARDFGVAVSTAVRYLKAEGLSIRGTDTLASSFNEEVFRRRDSAETRYWIGYLFSPRCEISELGDDAWFRVRFPFAHEEHLKRLRRLLEAPQDTKRCRTWETLDSIVLRVQSAMLVEMLHDVGIVPDQSKRVCKVRDLFFAAEFWRGLLDAVGVIEPNKLSVKAGPLLALQLLQYLQTLVPGVAGKVDGDWLVIQGEVVEDIVQAIYGADAAGSSLEQVAGGQTDTPAEVA